MRGWRLWLMVVCIGLASAWAGYWVSGRTQTAPDPAGASASELLSTPLSGLDGRRQTLQDWSDKIRVVNFWATWCPPCREELPALSALQTELGNTRVQFIGIALDDPATVREFLARTPLTYPVALAPGTTLSLTASLGNVSQGLPFTLLIDRDGRIVSHKLGLVDIDDLRRQLAAMTSPMH